MASSGFGILPGALAGIFASALVGSGVDDSRAEPVNTTIHEEEGGKGWGLAVFCLGLFGLISPLLLQGRLAPPISIVDPSMKGPGEILAQLEPASKPAGPKPAIVPESPVIVKESPPAAPPLPAFNFKPSPDLGKSRPEVWSLKTTEHLSSVDASPESPVALPATGHLIACIEANTDGKKVQLFDLLTLKQVKSWRVQHPVAHLAFSQDQKRLLFLGPGNAPAITVGNEDGSAAALPLLEPLPGIDSGIEWPKELEAVLHRNGKPAVVLSLETLLAGEDANRSFGPKFNEGPSWRISAGAVSHFSQSPPAAGAVPNWRVSRDACLSITHPQENIARLFPSVVLSVGERILVTPDGNILLRFTQKGLIAHYFERREGPPLDYSITMPHGPEKFPEGSPLREPEAWRKLHLMVYEPLLNPLTGKCIGPNRSRIHARARIVSWEETKARVRLSEVIEKIPASAVFADPHSESGGALELASLDTPHRWWCPAGDPLKDAPGPPAEPASAGTIQLSYHRGAYRIDALPSLKQEPLPAKTAAPPDPGETGPFPEIRRFVLEHHAKASRGEWAMMAANYGEQVHYFEQGLIPHSGVEQDLRNYHMKFRVVETVLEPIEIKELSNGRFEVRYRLQSDISSQATPFDRKETKVSLLVRKNQDGLKIVAHNPKR